MQKNWTLKNDTKNEHKPIKMIADTEKTKGKQKKTSFFFYLTVKKNEEPHKAVIKIDKITGEWHENITHKAVMAHKTPANNFLFWFW